MSTDGDGNRWRLQEIRRAIRALAADPASQLVSVAGIGTGELEDEFYNTILEHADDLDGVLEFSVAARTELDRIDVCFKAIAREDAWSDDALRGHHAWDEVRRAARSLARDLPAPIRGLEPPPRSLEEADLLFADDRGALGLFIVDSLHTTVVVGSRRRWSCLDLRATAVVGNSSMTTRWLDASSLIDSIVAWLRRRRWEKQSPIRGATGHIVLEARGSGLTAALHDPTLERTSEATISVDRATRVAQAARLKTRLERIVAGGSM